IEAYRALARSADPAVRAGALLRLARNLKAARRIEDSLAAYAGMAHLNSVAVAAAPAALVGRYARCQLLEETGRGVELRREAQALAADLHGALWPLTAPVYWLYAQDVSKWTGEPPRPGRPAELFGEAAAAL